jgi:hypothetical protein
MPIRSIRIMNTTIDPHGVIASSGFRFTTATADHQRSQRPGDSRNAGLSVIAETPARAEPNIEDGRRSILVIPLTADM